MALEQARMWLVRRSAARRSGDRQAVQPDLNPPSLPARPACTGITAAPVFRPTPQEWAMGPIAYLEKIRPEAAKYGLAHIVPPPGEPPVPGLPPNPAAPPPGSCCAGGRSKGCCVGVAVLPSAALCMTPMADRSRFCCSPLPLLPSPPAITVPQAGTRLLRWNGAPTV